MVVLMNLSQTYDVPPELALLYDFVNSLDERRYMENGALHNGGDEISTPLLLAEWMRARSPDCAGFAPSIAGIPAQPARPAAPSQSDSAKIDGGESSVSAGNGGFRHRIRAARARVRLECARPGAGANAGPCRNGPARSAQELRVRRVPLDLLRSFQARKSALVLIGTLRQPAKGTNLPRSAPSRRLGGRVHFSSSTRALSRAKHESNCEQSRPRA
jgi:hypothetical protein